MLILKINYVLYVSFFYDCCSLVFSFNFAKRLGFKSFCFHTIMMVVTCSNKITILKQTNVFWCFVMESMGSNKLKIGHYLILWYSNSRQNQLPISIITYFDSLSSILQRNLKNLSTSSLQMNSVDQVLNLFVINLQSHIFQAF